MSELLENYKKIAGHDAIDQLLQLSAPLNKMKIVHVNSTRLGGGVAEILSHMIPLTQALGIETHWEVIEGSHEFFQCTKNFHNALQGNKILPPASHLRVYETINAQNAERFKTLLQDANIVIIHDPQPLALIAHFPKRKGKWIWRCHIDVSKPFRPVWNYLKNYIEKFDATIFSLADFSHPLPHSMFVILPSIDPLSDKNRELGNDKIKEAHTVFGIDSERPILLQISRYDRFKDPVGVIEAYRLVKKFHKGVQLVLAGGGATDDPEQDIILKEVRLAAEDDPDIHVLLLPDNAHQTVNALQRGSDIILQKSLKEGFGLTVTEGMWKGKPIIGGNVGGIRIQVIDWHTGFLVNTPEGAAYHIRRLLQNPKEMQDMGMIGKEYVRERFLITRHVREYLTLIYALLFEQEDRIELDTMSLNK
jgi:trehalose synthase